ncbi:HEAT repeat domain-containing protein [Microseira wollei]|uniref:PBS lyase HEAT domain protein repeat-containing protein n=1 Tax=Microseira wollei NIES-4236 TaxID=2530354 RepID=A0AAV3XP53_9CYAN|nr:HEAT repeat domain-containing protein [Microseira wollei]GET41980.1 hypothetical protein MiSe_67940 [Microseira wollei NIES-4236]
MFLQTKNQEAAEKVFATAYTDLDPEVTSMDPAERLEFSRPSRAGIQRFDTRNDDDLREVIFDHVLSMERERAVWEYADRNKIEALSLLREVAKKDSDPSIRWSTLWAIQKFTGLHGKDTIAESLSDEHPEVRDWAKLLLREISGVLEGEADTREAKFDQTNPFDQTLPLLIAGYARVLVPGLGFVQATLSPQWFESIMGRVMACTVEKTFNTDLVIEKKIAKYYLSEKEHYEIYKFGGLTQELDKHIAHHQYQCMSRHTFFPSGKVGDISVEPIDDLDVILNRVAETEAISTSTIQVNLATKAAYPEASPSSQRTQPSKIVRSVRGKYMGFGYANLKQIISNEMKIGPGEVQLSSPHHPVVGALTNTFLFGTFKGKLSDLDDDGYLDINTEPCHGTVNGELDYGLTLKPNPNPFESL